MISDEFKKEYEQGHIKLTIEQNAELMKIKEQLKGTDGCMVDNEEERAIYKLIKEVALPSLHEHVSLTNPRMYQMFHGNLCRHASLVTCHIMRKLMKDWEWDVYEIDYSAKLFDNPYRCVHAFVFGKKDGKYRVIDMWDDLSLQLYTEVDSLHYPFEYDKVERDRVVHGIKKLDYDVMSKVTNEPLLGNVPILLEQVNMMLMLATLMF